MKTRHIIMILSLVVIFLVAVSIKDLKNTEELTCTVNTKMYEMDSLTTLKVTVKNNEIRNMKVDMDITIPEEAMAQKQELINYFQSQGKSEVTATDKGFRLSSGMYSDYFNSLGLSTKSSYNEIKQVLEFQGYKCK